jgi:hypothetical protein
MASYALHYELTPEEYVEAWRLHLLGHYARPLNVVMIAALAYIAFKQWQLTPHAPVVLGLAVAVIALIGFRVYTYLRLPYLRLRKLPGLLERHEVTIGDEGVRLKTSRVDATIPWKDFRNVRETHDLLILYKGPNAYLPMPKRAAGDEAQLEGLRALIASKLRQG